MNLEVGVWLRSARDDRLTSGFSSGKYPAAQPRGRSYAIASKAAHPPLDTIRVMTEQIDPLAVRKAAFAHVIGIEEDDVAFARDPRYRSSMAYTVVLYWSCARRIVISQQLARLERVGRSGIAAVVNFAQAVGGVEDRPSRGPLPQVEPAGLLRAAGS